MPKHLEKKVTAELEELVAFMRTTKAHFIIVSNEVGLGLVPAISCGPGLPRCPGHG